MGLPIKEGIELAGLTFGIDSRRKRLNFAAIQKAEGKPKTVLTVSGLASTHRHLSRVEDDARARLPEGSDVVSHKFSTYFNFALMPSRRLFPVELEKLGIPHMELFNSLDTREVEIRRIGDEIQKLSDKRGEPITLMTYSLGGVLGMEAWLRHPDRVDNMVAAAVPFRMPGIGVSERPDNGRLHIVRAKKDGIVHRWFSSHGQHDMIEDIEGGHFHPPVSEEGVTTIVDFVLKKEDALLTPEK